MIKKTTSWAVLLYGLIIAALGYVGFMQAGSVVSLYAGTGFGALLVLVSILMFFQITLGAYLSLFFTFLLTATFAIRYSITQKGVPAILAVFSGGMLLFLLTRVVKWKK